MPQNGNSQSVDYDVQPSDPGPPTQLSGNNGLWLVILKLLGLA